MMGTAERVLLEDALISLAERAGRVDHAVTEAAQGLVFPGVTAGLEGLARGRGAAAAPGGAEPRRVIQDARDPVEHDADVRRAGRPLDADPPRIAGNSS